MHFSNKKLLLLHHIFLIFKLSHTAGKWSSCHTGIGSVVSEHFDEYRVRVHTHGIGTDTDGISGDTGIGIDTFLFEKPTVGQSGIWHPEGGWNIIRLFLKLVNS